MFFFVEMVIGVTIISISTSSNIIIIIIVPFSIILLNTNYKNSCSFNYLLPFLFNLGWTVASGEAIHGSSSEQ